jgi:hypothetical protein
LDVGSICLTGAEIDLWLFHRGMNYALALGVKINIVRASAPAVTSIQRLRFGAKHFFA